MELYKALLEQGVAVICDDRDMRFGAKMADFELVGVALYGVIIGKGLESGTIEWIIRDGLEREVLESSNALEIIPQKIQKNEALCL